MNVNNYKQNNAHLAVALNEVKQEVNALKNEIIAINHELGRERFENATLKAVIKQKETQFQTLKMRINEYIQTQTTGLTQILTLVNPPIMNQIETNGENNVSNENLSNVRSRNAEIRRSLNATNPNRLPDLEEHAEEAQQLLYVTKRSKSATLSPRSKRMNLHESPTASDTSTSSTEISPRRVSSKRRSRSEERGLPLKCAKNNKRNNANDMIENKENDVTVARINKRPRRRSVQNKQYQEPKLNTKMRQK